VTKKRLSTLNTNASDLINISILQK